MSNLLISISSMDILEHRWNIQLRPESLNWKVGFECAAIVFISGLIFTYVYMRWLKEILTL